MSRVEFYYDVVCPYAYLASTKVEALAARHGAQVEWIPILLGGLLREVGSPTDPNQTHAPTRATLGVADFKRSAQLWGVPLAKPDAHPRRTVDAMRLVVGAGEGKRTALSRALFEAYWVHGRDVADRAVLAELAGQHGVDPAVIDSPRAREGLFATTRRAAAAGAFGVPTFVVGDRLVWGQDRMWMVDRALGGEPTDPAAPATEGSQPAQPRRIRFFHDFSSPFAYLAATQIDRVAAEHGAQVQWCPILLGALFREIGTPDVPLFEMAAVKQAWVRRDLEDWAQAWGVPFRFPNHFPMRSILPLRATLVEPKAALPIYRAAWAQDRRVDEPEALAAVLADAGLDPEPIIAGTQDPKIKAALKANTTAAREAGACGVPTFEITPSATPRSEAARILIWGQDRLSMVAAALRGWCPEGT